MPYNFHRVGFDSAIYQSNDFFNADNLEIPEGTIVSDIDYKKTSSIWSNKRQIYLNSKFMHTRKQLYIFGLFRLSPEWLRETIYNSGSWCMRVQKTPDNALINPDFVYPKYVSTKARNKSIKYYSALDMFPEMSAVSKNPKNQFIFVTNNLTHEPYAIGNDLEITTSGRPKFPRNIVEKYGHDIEAVQHLYTDAAAMNLVAKWLKWMKENDVYNNTRIILVSDHGRYVYDPIFKSQTLPFKKNLLTHPGSFDNILLIKDFNARGELKTDSSFKTSASVPGIAMKGIVDGINPYSGKPIKDPEEIFPFHLYFIPWNIYMQDKYKYVPLDHFVIHTEDDLFDPEKWQAISE